MTTDERADVEDCLRAATEMIAGANVAVENQDCVSAMMHLSAARVALGKAMRILIPEAYKEG